MGSIFLLLGLAITAALFWQMRSQSEAAAVHLERYCQQCHLQLISVASDGFMLSREPLTLLRRYRFEFSSSGEEAYQGTLWLRGLQVAKIELPPYRSLATNHAESVSTTSRTQALSLKPAVTLEMEPMQRPSLTPLFEQLQLPSDEVAQYRFYRQHKLQPRQSLLDAAFWTAQQRAFLTAEHQNDEWKDAIDELERHLRP